MRFLGVRWFLCSGLVWLAAVSSGCADDNAQLSQVDAGVLCTSCGGCAQSLPVVSAMHVSGHIDYPDTPPASGPHNGTCWADWGALETEVPPERWVHNLEHGGVVFLYRCDEGCEADLGVLRELVSAHPRTLLTSYAELPTRFAAISWGVRMLSDCLDRAAFEAFYAMHVAHAPENIAAPPSAVCARAVDPLAL
jgi:hypothetical protein